MAAIDNENFYDSNAYIHTYIRIWQRYDQPGLRAESVKIYCLIFHRGKCGKKYVGFWLMDKYLMSHQTKGLLKTNIKLSSFMMDGPQHLPLQYSALYCIQWSKLVIHQHLSQLNQCISIFLHNSSVWELNSRDRI